MRHCAVRAPRLLSESIRNLGLDDERGRGEVRDNHRVLDARRANQMSHLVEGEGTADTQRPVVARESIAREQAGRQPCTREGGRAAAQIHDYEAA